MNSKQLFEIALGDIQPWFIEKIEFLEGDDKAKELHLHLDFAKGSTFRDENGTPCKAYDTKVHTWRHLNFFEHRCYLHAFVPRITGTDDKVKTVQVPWARRNTGFTLLFEAYSMSLIELEMPVSNVARLLGENDQRIWNVFHYWVGKAREGTCYEGITKVGLDETSTRKGHSYVTVGVDLDQRRVFEVAEGKDSKAVVQLGDFLEQHGSPKSGVGHLSIDMSPAFIAGCMDTFENGKITFDRFHVTKVVGDAMDKLRRQERAECELLKGHKYTLLKNPMKLSGKKMDQLFDLLELYPKIGEGYRLKELLKEFWDFDDPKLAEEFLDDWCKRADASGIFPFQGAARTIRAHWSGIVNYTMSKISNGILEGINSKVQFARKRARGYRNTKNFISMILFLCGKLEFQPLYAKR
jgi:transposase